MKKKFYAILLTALMLFSVGCGAAMAATATPGTLKWTLPSGLNNDENGINIGTMLKSSDVIYGNTIVASTDWNGGKIIALESTSSTDTDLKFSYTFDPAMDTNKLDLKMSFDASTDKGTLFAWLEGTAPDVKEDTTYHLYITPARNNTALGENSTGKPSPLTATLTFTVAVNPLIDDSTSNKPAEILWGKDWTFKPMLKNVDEEYYVSADWSLELSGDYFLSDDVLSGDGIKFDPKTGTLSGKWMPAYCSTDITSPDWNSPDVELPDLKDTKARHIKLKVTRGASGQRQVSNDKTFDLTFKAVAPEIKSSDNAITTALADLNNKKGFMWSKDISPDNGVVITAIGPGIISWDVNGYSVISSTSPDANVVSDDSLGLVYDAKQEGYTSTLRIYGKPTTTVYNKKFPITAKNVAGSTTVTAILSIGSDSFDVKVSPSSTAALPSKDVRVGENIGTVTLIAEPGPVEWAFSTNLPDGLTLTELPDGKTATLTGTFATARERKDSIIYSITAKNTNTNVNKEKTISADIKVWGKPVVTDTIADTIKTKTKYEWILDGTNYPDYTSWDVEIDGLEKTATGWRVEGGTSCISLDKNSTNKAGDNVAKLVGSIDRVPSGAKFTVKVTAENYFGKSDPETFTVNVDAVAPVMKAQGFVLNTEEGDASVTAGDAPLTMTAEIDATTAKKFGASSAITLGKTPDTYTGLSFICSEDGKARFKYSQPANGAVAYTNLPVTVTATNTATSKYAKVKHTVTVTGKSPSFVNSNDISEKYCDILGSSVDVPAAVTLTVQAGMALPVTDANKRIVFRIDGANPLITTIKPTTANGIDVETEENGKLLTFTGTPKAAKKDVTSKFTITTTNPLTNESKKIVVTIVAKPTPVIDTSKGLEKEVLVGKKVKITPKAIVTTTGMKWAVKSISGGNPNGGGTVTANDDLANYGLVFDAAKGTISGTALYPTGKDAPILVEFYASDSDGKISSDVATAKITILGAKPKLTTKKMTLNTTQDVSAITDANGGVIYTNLSGANEGETGGLMKADVQLTAMTPLPEGISITNNNNNTPTLSGTAKVATKKLATEFKLTNFGTEAKGKITFMVTDGQPVIEPVTTNPSVTVGSSSTITLKVRDATNSDLKYKWKITTKPSVSGVSAKIKGNGMYATVTVKANKKVDASATASDTINITVTDPLTKTASDAFPLVISITDGTTTNDSPLEAGEMKAETKAEAKDIAAVEKEVKDVALGEGEVHMGAGRTADKLTAAQRKAIEDKGYVIAAVLPEIEVTASGQYDFEVDLDKEVKTGAELVWFAFSTKPTTDDEIVDFADEKGEETKVVPESHVVIVAPWLNAEAKYAPVIAVKADAKDADATTAEGVKEAAEAKTEE